MCAYACACFCSGGIELEVGEQEREITPRTRLCFVEMRRRYENRTYGVTGTGKVNLHI